MHSYALRTDDGVILFDPIAPSDDVLREGNVKVVLTAEWHRRDAEKLGLPIRGDDLPPDVTAQPAFFPGERTLWIPAQNALVAGDCLLLDLPVELLLPTHGDPVLDDAHDALRRALS